MKYNRQISLIGENGQARIKNAKVLVIGAGGLGSPVITYLACAGVGNITVIDKDIVDITNLNRQFLYSECDINKSKALCVSEKYKNSDINLNGINAEVTNENISTLLDGYDVVVDCVDNFNTRRIVNNFCVSQDINLVEAGIDGMYGFVTCINKNSACLECLGINESKPKEKIAVLGTTAGVIGSLQANECIKILLSLEEVLFSKMLQYDGFTNSFEVIDLQKSSTCALHK